MFPGQLSRVSALAFLAALEARYLGDQFNRHASRCDARTVHLLPQVCRPCEIAINWAAGVFHFGFSTSDDKPSIADALCIASDAR